MTRISINRQTSELGHLLFLACVRVIRGSVSPVFLTNRTGGTTFLDLNSVAYELPAQVVDALVDDAVPAARPRARDVGRQIVNEQALLRGATGKPLTVFEEVWIGLARA